MQLSDTMDHLASHCPNVGQLTFNWCDHTNRTYTFSLASLPPGVHSLIFTNEIRDLSTPPSIHVDGGMNNIVRLCVHGFYLYDHTFSTICNSCPHLNVIWVDNFHCTDPFISLPSLAKLGNLSVLCLSRLEIDFPSLFSINKHEYLNLLFTCLGRSGIKRLLLNQMLDCGFSDETVHTIINSFQGLTHMSLSSNGQLTDLSLNYLNAASHLIHLNLINTNISKATVTTFKQHHPNCHVVWSHAQ